MLEKYVNHSYPNSEKKKENLINRNFLHIFLAILYSEEKESTRFNASRNSSWDNALLRMDGGEIRTGRS